MKVTTESDRCPKAAVDQNQRTVSCPQDRLRRGESLPATTAEDPTTITTTTTMEDPPTITTTTTAEDPPTITTTPTMEDPPTTTTTEYR